MKKTSRILNLILIGCACVATSVAATFTESGDAGNTLATAQTVSGGANPLTLITGTLSAGSDADIYRLYIPVGATFSATTVGGATFDTQLFLLNGDGFGIYTNDDSTGSIRQSTLPAGHVFSPSAAGIYHLVISSFDNDPRNASGKLFPNTFSGVFGPTGPGGALAFTSMTGGSGSGAYSISLQGAEFVTSTPEPGTFLVLGAGLLAIASIRRRRFLN